LYQSLDSLKIGCPNHVGDWYFSGNYPTQGGNMLVNNDFIGFLEGTYFQESKIATDKHNEISPSSGFSKVENYFTKPISEVYLSYSRQQNDLANIIESQLTLNGTAVFRDTNAVLYKGNIETFIKKLGYSDKIIVLLSQDYFKSIYCMHEILLAFKSRNFEKKIFPVAVGSPQDYFNYKSKLKFVEYWSDKQNQIVTEIRQVDVNNLASMSSIIEELALIKQINSSIDSIITSISKLNIRTFDEMKKSNFNELLASINRE
ncbi:MAG: toll/interleukin-1 receptor domain-containing protein, partial [Marinoscillum sp.]